VKKLVKEKSELTETLQDKLKELKKAIEVTYGMHDVIRECQSIITSLRSQEERDHEENAQGKGLTIEVGIATSRARD